MSGPDPTGSRPPQPPGEPEGTLRPTSPGALVAWVSIGLVAGWLVRPVSERLDRTAPIVTWGQPTALFFVAAVLGGTAWITWRAVHVRHERLEPHRAVNRLVLARACAFVGALVAGAYAGYAVSWLGLDAELADQRAWRSAAAALAGLGICMTALLLERACRVRSEDPEP